MADFMGPSLWHAMVLLAQGLAGGALGGSVSGTGSGETYAYASTPASGARTPPGASGTGGGAMHVPPSGSGSAASSAGNQ